MRFTFPANSSSSDGSTYFLSPQMSRLRQSVAWPEAKRSCIRSRSAADSLTVSTVWKGSAIRGGATLFPLSSYLPSQINSVMSALLVWTGGTAGLVLRAIVPKARFHALAPVVGRP